MSILRLFIIKEWFRSFFTAAVSLFVLISVANLVSGLLRGNVLALEVLMNYFLELPGTLAKIIPLSCLMGSLFSLNKIRSRNELSAIFASGFSRKKFVTTILISVTPVMLFEFLLLGYIDPILRKNKELFLPNAVHKFRNLSGSGLSASTIGSGKFWYKSDHSFISFSAYNKQEKSIHDFTIYLIGPDQKLITMTKGKQLNFKNNSWISTDTLEVKDLNLENFHSASILSSSVASLKEKATDLEQIESDITTLNFLRLLSYIRSLSKVGINVNEYLTIFYDKVNNSIMCIIFALISIGAIFNPNRRGVSIGMSIGLVFTFTMFYWLFYSYLFELGKGSKLSPILAVFSVSILFTVGIIHLFYKNRRLR